MAIEDALRAVCALLFKEPWRVTQFMCHRRHKKPWTNPVHHHDDLVQLDLCEGFEGLVLQADRRIACNESMAFVHYPGVRHQSHLMPRHRAARLFSLKLRLPSEQDLLRKRCLPSAARNFGTCRELLEALSRLERVSATFPSDDALRIAVVTEVLCLWPHVRGRTAPTADGPSRESRTQNLIERTAAYIEDSIEQSVSVEDVARHVGISKRQLLRILRATLGIGIRELIEQRRLTVARERLADPRGTATEIAAALGFSSVHAFSRWFSRLTGQAPGHYRATFRDL